MNKKEERLESILIGVLILTIVVLSAVLIFDITKTITGRAGGETATEYVNIGYGRIIAGDDSSYYHPEPQVLLITDIVPGLISCGDSGACATNKYKIKFTQTSDPGLYNKEYIIDRADEAIVNGFDYDSLTVAGDASVFGDYYISGDDKFDVYELQQVEEPTPIQPASYPYNSKFEAHVRVYEGAKFTSIEFDESGGIITTETDIVPEIIPEGRVGDPLLTLKVYMIKFTSGRSKGVSFPIEVTLNSNDGDRLFSTSFGFGAVQGDTFDVYKWQKVEDTAPPFIQSFRIVDSSGTEVPLGDYNLFANSKYSLKGGRGYYIDAVFNDSPGLVYLDPNTDDNYFVDFYELYVQKMPDGETNWYTFGDCFKNNIFSQTHDTYTSSTQNDNCVFYFPYGEKGKVEYLIHLKDIWYHDVWLTQGPYYYETNSLEPVRIINSGLDSLTGWNVVKDTYTNTGPYVTPKYRITKYISAYPKSGSNFVALPYQSNAKQAPYFEQTINILTGQGGDYKLCAQGINLGGDSQGIMCLGNTCRTANPRQENYQWSKYQWFSYCTEPVSLVSGQQVKILFKGFGKTHYFGWDEVTLRKVGVESAGANSNIFIRSSFNKPVVLSQILDDGSFSEKLLASGSYKYNQLSAITSHFAKSVVTFSNQFSSLGFYRFKIFKEDVLIDDIALDASISDRYVLSLDDGNYKIEAYSCGDYFSILESHGIDAQYFKDLGNFEIIDGSGINRADLGFYPLSIDFIGTGENIQLCDRDGDNPEMCDLSRIVFDEVQRSCSNYLGSISAEVFIEDGSISQTSSSVTGKAITGFAGGDIDAQQMDCTMEGNMQLLSGYINTCYKSVTEDFDCGDRTISVQAYRDIRLTLGTSPEAISYCGSLINQLTDCGVKPEIYQGPKIPYVQAMIDLNTISATTPLPPPNTACGETGGVAYLCKSEPVPNQELCGKLLINSQQKKIAEVTKEMVGNLSSLVSGGYVWDDTPYTIDWPEPTPDETVRVPTSAKINGLRARANDPSQSFKIGKTLSELEKFYISKYYFLTAHEGAYFLAKEYYGFKPFDPNKNSLGFDNKPVHVMHQMDEYCTITPGIFDLGGICEGMTQMVDAFWKNSDATSKTYLSREQLTDIFVYAPETGLRVKAPALRDIAGVPSDDVKKRITYLQNNQARSNLDLIIGMNMYELKEAGITDLLTPHSFYVKLLNSLAIGRPDIFGYIPFPYYYPGHAVLLVNADKEGNLIVYNSNTDTIGLTELKPGFISSKGLSFEESVLKSDGKKEGHKPVFIEDKTKDGSYKPNTNLGLHTKNCRCSGICGTIIRTTLQEELEYEFADNGCESL